MFQKGAAEALQTLNETRKIGIPYRWEGGERIQELKMSLSQSTRDCEAFQNLPKKLETDREQLEFPSSIAEKDQSLNTQRSEHEKQVQETNKEGGTND